MKKFLLSIAGLLALCVAYAAPANAANCNVATGICFWVGGTGTMDLATDSAHWSNSTGGVSCSCEPTTTSQLTFDGSSGGGTVTAAASLPAFQSLSVGAFTGTLTFGTNNPNVTLNAGTPTNIILTGAATKTINFGSGTWTLKNTASNLWDCTTVGGLTLQASSATFIVNNNFTAAASIIGCGNSASFNMGNWQIGSGQSTAGAPSLATTSGYMNNLTLTGGAVDFSNGQTYTVNGTFSTTSTSSTPAELRSTLSSTIALTNNATASWIAFRGITFSTSHMTATNCFNLNGNNFGSGGTCTAPSAGGGGIIYAQ